MMSLLALATSALSSSATRWTRAEALALANHPLVIQLGTGVLPAGSANRLMLARAAVVEGLESAAANAAASSDGGGAFSFFVPNSLFILSLRPSVPTRFGRARRFSGVSGLP